MTKDTGSASCPGMYSDVKSWESVSGAAWEAGGFHNDSSGLPKWIQLQELVVSSFFSPENRGAALERSM